MTMRTDLYVGSYTTTASASSTSAGTPPAGIHVYEVTADGEYELRSAVTGIDDASYVTLHPDGRRLYAVSETTPQGGVVAFDRDPDDGSLTEIDRTASLGAAPCHLTVDPTGRHLVVANYVSGSVAAFALAPDGRFAGAPAMAHHRGAGPHPRQEGPHAHCAVPDPTGRWVHVADLGTDRIVQYDLLRSDDAGPRTDDLKSVGEVATAPGSGPRHLAFHPNLPVAFAVCELDCTLVVFDVDDDVGALTTRSIVPTLPDDGASESLAAAIRIHPGGDRIVVSNRGHDSIATFAFVDVATPPRLLGHVASGGRTPRDLAIHPSGRSMVVANADSDTLVEFDLDTTTGVPSRGRVVAHVPRPVCVAYGTVGS